MAVAKSEEVFEAIPTMGKPVLKEDIHLELADLLVSLDLLTLLNWKARLAQDDLTHSHL